MTDNLLTYDIPRLVAFITGEIRTRADKKAKWPSSKTKIWKPFGK